MKLTPEEKADVKDLLEFLIEKKAEASGGHNGFQLKDLETFLRELEEENRIKRRSTIAADMYFKP